jgi:hypothetical protein
MNQKRSAAQQECWDKDRALARAELAFVSSGIFKGL